MGLTLNRRNSADGSYADTQRGSLIMSAAPPTEDLLNEGQQRHLIASLARVERALHDITRILGERSVGPSRLLDRSVADLPTGYGASARPLITAAEETVAELVRVFDLAAPVGSHFRSVQALVVSSMVVVEDTVTRNLRGYGDIHPRLPVTLDPLLELLHEQLMDIGRALPARAAVPVAEDGA